MKPDADNKIMYRSNNNSSRSSSSNCKSKGARHVHTRVYESSIHSNAVIIKYTMKKSQIYFGLVQHDHGSISIKSNNNNIIVVSTIAINRSHNKAINHVMLTRIMMDCDYDDTMVTNSPCKICFSVSAMTLQRCGVSSLVECRRRSWVVMVWIDNPHARTVYLPFTCVAVMH